MRYLSVLLIITHVYLSDSIECPTGNGKACDRFTSCTTNTKCYGDLDNAKTPSCCRILCPMTEMMTFHSANGIVYSHKMNTELNSTWYYEDSNTSMACPFPYSRTTINFGNELPVGFSVNGSDTLKSCKTNGDCDDGQYCGDSVNPSFADRDVRDEKKISTIDESDEGEPRRFCYKNPIIDNKFTIVLNSSSIGLALCDDNSECPSGSICLLMSKSLKYLDTDGKGMCVNPVICDIPNTQTRSIGVFPKNGNYCTNANDCEGMMDEVYKPDCVPFQHNNSKTGSLCCFTAAQCQYGTAKTPKVSCKNNADCNKGMTPWTSWCDDKGYCCQDTTRTETAFCPDGVTLALNEPGCQGTCKNGGVCINGHCCPGTKVEEGKLILGERPYATKTKCDPNEELPRVIMNAYCSPDGFVVAIGRRDAFGDEYVRETERLCMVNADCGESNSTFCVRESEKQTSCFRSAFKKVEKKNDSPTNDNFVVIVVVVVLAVLVVVGIGIAILRRRNLKS